MREQQPNLMFRMNDESVNSGVTAASWTNDEHQEISDASWADEISAQEAPLAVRFPKNSPKNMLAAELQPDEQLKPCFIQKTGLNALVRAASPLIAIIIQLKREPKECDINILRQQMMQEIKQFEVQAKLDGVPAVTVLAARYVLCTAIDESVLITPLGNSGDWGVRSLLSTFHQDTWGGEKFFHVLERMCEDPAVNIDLLELMYICLSLGFKGKFRVLKGGQEQINAMRAHLYRIIQRERGGCERELSTQWRSKASATGQTRPIPVWRVLTGTLIIVTAIFSGFSTVLYQKAAPLSEQLKTLVQPYTATQPNKDNERNQL